MIRHHDQLLHDDVHDQLLHDDVHDQLLDDDVHVASQNDYSCRIAYSLVCNQKRNLNKKTHFNGL